MPNSKTDRSRILALFWAFLGCASALFLPIFYPFCCVAANVYGVSALIGKTKKKTMPLPAPDASHGAKRAIATFYMIPKAPLIAAALVGSVATAISGNALLGFLLFLTCGGMVYPIVIAAWQRRGFESAMLSSLTWGAVGLTVTGAAQVFLSSPGFSFRVGECLRNLYISVQTALTELFTAAVDYAPTEETKELYGELLGTVGAEDLTTALTDSIFRIFPAVCAIAMLALSAAVWFWVKKRESRRTEIDIAAMGSLDSYFAGRHIATVYVLAILINVFASGSSAIGIASLNVTYVTAAVIAFGGFSFILGFLRAKISSRPLRILLTVVAVAAAFSTMGNWVLTMIGLFTAGRARNGGGKTRI